MSENKSPIKGDDIRRFIPLYANLKLTAGIAEQLLENAARVVDRPPNEEDELEDDRLSGRVLRIATDSAEALPELASANAVLEHGLTAPASAAAVLLRAAEGLLKDEKGLQRLGRALSEAEQERIKAADRVLPALEQALRVLDQIGK